MLYLLRCHHRLCVFVLKLSAPRDMLHAITICLLLGYDPKLTLMMEVPRSPSHDSWQDM
jgi:hypothetical protein